MALIKRAKPADAIEEEAEPELIPLDEEPEATPVAEAQEDDQPGDADTMAALAAEPAEPAGAGADRLLDMFSTVGIATVDRTALLDLAGNVEIDDLVSELSLVAAALGLVKGQRAAIEDEQEPLAA